jgi:hypothetical protein
MGPERERSSKMQDGKLIFEWPSLVAEQKFGLDPGILRYEESKPYDRIIVAFIYSVPFEELDPISPTYKGTWQSVQLWVKDKSKPAAIVCKGAATTDTRNGLELKAASCTVPVKANCIVEVEYAYKPSIAEQAIPAYEEWEFRL